jgi:ABC-type phosphate transport system substrate-binding protein
MRRSHFVKLALASAICGTLLAGAVQNADAQGGFVVIVNHANPTTSLSAAELSKLFLKKQAKWSGGAKAAPVDQPESSPVRRQFSDAVHKMDVPSVKSYWQELVFSGRGEPPPERPSDGDVIAYVKANPNAIGYIAMSAQTPDVKVISVTK